MKERFVVFDTYLTECGRFTTVGAAIKSAQEQAGDGYSEDDTYYVAQILGKAVPKTPAPLLAPYTPLPAPKKVARKKK